MAEQVGRDVKLPNRILVGFDEAGLADDAVRAAVALATVLRARLRLLHVVPKMPDGWPSLSSSESVERTEDLIRTVEANASDRARELLAGSAFRVEDVLRVVQGRPAEVLVDEAPSPDEDLIVLGARRHAGLLHFGGTLRTVLAKARCSAWVQATPPAKVERILAPIDLSEHSLHALALACALGVRFGAQVTVLHAFDSTNLYRFGWPDGFGLSVAWPIDEARLAVQAQFVDALRDFDWRGAAHSQVFVEANARQAILEHSRAHDLVVVGTHGRTGLAAAVLGNTAWTVLAECTKPSLVVRHPERSFVEPGLARVDVRAAGLVPG